MRAFLVSVKETVVRKMQTRESRCTSQRRTASALLQTRPTFTNAQQRDVACVNGGAGGPLNIVQSLGMTCHRRLKTTTARLCAKRA